MLQHRRAQVVEHRTPPALPWYHGTGHRLLRRQHQWPAHVADQQRRGIHGITYSKYAGHFSVQFHIAARYVSECALYKKEKKVIITT